MQDFTKLNEALMRFRDVFINNILPTTELVITGPFLKTLTTKGHKNWSVSEAMKLYQILKPYSLTLKKVNFDFSLVPPVELIISKAPTGSLSQPQQARTPKQIGYNGTQFTVAFSFVRELYVDVKAIKDAKWND